MTHVSTTCAEAISRVKMASTQVAEMLLANSSPTQDSSNQDGHFPSRYVTPVFTPFSLNVVSEFKSSLMTHSFLTEQK